MAVYTIYEKIKTTTSNTCQKLLVLVKWHLFKTKIIKFKNRKMTLSNRQL